MVVLLCHTMYIAAKIQFTTTTGVELNQLVSTLNLFHDVIPSFSVYLLPFSCQV